MAKALTTRTPDTVSCKVEVRSAIRSWEMVLSLRNRTPIQPMIAMLNGATRKATRVSRQLRVIARVSAAISINGFLIRVTNPAEMLLFTNVTSLVMREMICPARVR